MKSWSARVAPNKVGDEPANKRPGYSKDYRPEYAHWIFSRHNQTCQRAGDQSDDDSPDNRAYPEEQHSGDHVFVSFSDSISKSGQTTEEPTLPLHPTSQMIHGKTNV